MSKSDLNRVVSYLEKMEYSFNKETPSILADVIIEDSLNHESYVFGAIDCCSQEVLIRNLDSVLNIVNDHNIGFRWDVRAQNIADAVIESHDGKGNFKYPNFVLVAANCCSSAILRENIFEVLEVLNNDKYYRFDPNSLGVSIIADTVIKNASTYSNLVSKVVDYCSTEILRENISEVLEALNDDKIYIFNPNSPSASIIADTVINNASKRS